MRQAEKYFHQLEAARRVIEPYRADNPYQKELYGLLLVIMNHVEKTHCQPGVALDEKRDFDRWMSILKRFWRALRSPEMAGRRARAVLAKLLR